VGGDTAVKRLAVPSGSATTNADNTTIIAGSKKQATANRGEQQRRAQPQFGDLEKTATRRPNVSSEKLRFQNRYRSSGNFGG